MAEMKVMKDEIFQEIETNLEIRKAISEVDFVQSNSVRMLAIKRSDKLTRYNILCIVKRILKLKTIEEMFITRQVRK